LSFRSLYVIILAIDFERNILMINIAILGFGVVGSGVADVVERDKKAIEDYLGQTINVKYILDIRDFPDSPYRDRVVKDISVILKDESVKIVCETMGRIHPAREFTIEAMKAGKSVVTSNKELVANCGVELIRTAEENNVYYEFEASVGGGIPEIRSIRTSLAAANIVRIDGIMNGTTNYILTKMYNSGTTYEETLKEAQALGYAEADPTADIMGIDAQRKIMILAALATGRLVQEKDVHTEGITKINSDDIDAAKRMDCSVKLIGTFKLMGEKMAIFVSPMLVPNEDLMAHVNDVYNAINVTTANVGNYVYYGKGAGKYPTAGALVADLSAILSDSSEHEKKLDWKIVESSDVADFSQCRFRYYIRMSGTKANTSVELNGLIGKFQTVSSAKDGKMEIITNQIGYTSLENVINNKRLCKVESVIRFLGE
jgi:homoserine dehydrogenase